MATFVCCVGDFFSDSTIRGICFVMFVPSSEEANLPKLTFQHVGILKSKVLCIWETNMDITYFQSMSLEEHLSLHDFSSHKDFGS